MKLSSTLSTCLLATCFSTVFAAPASLDTRAASTTTETDGSDYIIMLNANDNRTIPEVIAAMHYNMSAVKHIYDNGAFRGFAVTVPQTHVMMLQDMSDIQTYEKETHMKLALTPQIQKFRLAKRALEKREAAAQDVSAEEDVPVHTYPYTGTSKLAKRAFLYLQQNIAPWNLQRASSVSTLALGSKSDTDLDYQYRFDATGGDGVDIYMIDTGINTANTDFEGRAQMIYSVDGNMTDSEGHGTHTAGTAGSLTYGVAKKSNLLGIKVFASNGEGTLSDTIQGINIAVQRHMVRKSQQGFAGSVISMSLGATAVSAAMKVAIQQAIVTGIHFSVAAGNEGADACGTTPAGISGDGVPIFSVGASDVSDTRASFSNYGRCVDVYAPGTDITSTFIPNTDSVAVLQGTSMSTPLVAGMIAYQLVLNPNLMLNVAEMKTHIMGMALQNKIKDTSGAPGTLPLIYNGFPGNPQ